MELPQFEMNKKLLYSLPRSWDTNISIIKSAYQIQRISLNELISVIRSYELVNKQRDLRHATTMNTTGVQSTNTAFASGISQSPSQGVNMQQMFAAVGMSSSNAQSSSKTPSPTQVKEIEQNFALFNGMMGAYNAFITGQLNACNLKNNEFNQVHHADVEEMDINWTMAMAVWRAKNFVDKYRINKWETTVQGRWVLINLSCVATIVMKRAISQEIVLGSQLIDLQRGDRKPTSLLQ